MKRLIFLFLMVFLFVSCTKNTMVKNYGGISTLQLKENEKLINVTWKNNDLWILTRKMTDKDSAETYVFREESEYGLWNGKYIIEETKK